MSDRLSNVELNILVAERVMGLKVLGVATCIYIDGGQDVAVTWSHESSYACQDPVYLPADHAVPCERCAEPESDIYGKFRGYSDGCLKIVPQYSEDISAAMEVLSKFDVWHIEKSDLAEHSYTVFVAKHQHLHSSLMDKGEAEGDSLPRTVCEAALATVSPSKV